MVYDPDRVKIRYLVVLKNKEVCHCCHVSKDESSVKALAQHDLMNFHYSYFNKYETEIAQAYLVHLSKSIQSIFSEGLEDFIKQKAFSKSNINIDDC